MSIESYPSPNGVLTSLIWRKTMSGAETSLSGYDNASQALSYTPGQEQVYLNGILLVRGDDYTATNGTSITGLSALAASDYVQVNCYNNFSVASVPAQNITGTVTNAQLANSAITINGSAISLGGTVTLAGDIESVTATSPLTGGGSTGALTVGIQSASTTQSGAVQLSDSTSTTSSVLAATPTAVKSAYDLANGAIPKTLTTTTGDIIYASAANTPARLGIGTTGQVLKVASGIPSWGAATSGMTLINRTSYTASATLNVDGVFTSAYNSYVVVMEGVGSGLGSTDNLRMKMRVAGATITDPTYYGNALTTQHYNTTITNTAGSALTYWTLALAAGSVPGANAGRAWYQFQGVGNNSEGMTFFGNHYTVANTQNTQAWGGENTARVYDGFQLLTSGGNTLVADIAIYGLAKA